MPDYYATVELRLDVRAVDENDAKLRIIRMLAAGECSEYNQGCTLKGMDVVCITEEQDGGS
jgi:hypothetical protein